jgi:hypothetical protein
MTKYKNVTDRISLVMNNEKSGNFLKAKNNREQRSLFWESGINFFNVELISTRKQNLCITVMTRKCFISHEYKILSTIFLSLREKLLHS